MSITFDSKQCPMAFTLIVFGCLLAGCAFVREEPFAISGGQNVNLTVERPWPRWTDIWVDYLPAENEHFRLDAVGCYPVVGHQGELHYGFSLRLKHGDAPDGITIEDASDAEAELLVEDHAPRFQTPLDQHLPVWSGTSAAQPLAHHNFQWLKTDHESVRIYRFTIVASTGKSETLYQTVNYSHRYKRFIVQHG